MNRTMCLIYALLVVGSLFGFPPLAAAEESVARSELSVGDALALARLHIPNLVRAQNEQRVVESRTEGAKLWLTQNPYASVLVGKRKETTSDPIATGVQYQIHVEQALEIAGQRWARLSAVASQVEVAKAQTALAQVESRALLLTSYVQASLAAQRVVVAL